jgi:hypothetical protein
MEKGNFRHHPLMRLTLSFTLVFLLGFWLTNFGMYFSKMDLSAQSVVDYYRGSEIKFLPPRSFEGLVETSHFHLPMMALIVLVLTHLTIFVPIPDRAKLSIIILSFVSAAGQEGASWLVRYGHPLFAYLKIASFLVLQALILLMLLALAGYLWRWDKKI